MTETKNGVSHGTASTVFGYVYVPVFGSARTKDASRGTQVDTRWIVA